VGAVRALWPECRLSPSPWSSPGGPRVRRAWGLGGISERVLPLGCGRMAASHFSLFAGVLGAQTLARPLKRRTSSVARAGCRACVRRVGGRDMFRDILVQWQPHISPLAPVPLHWTPLRGLASLGCFTDCGARRGWVRVLELRARRDNGRYVLRAAGPSVLGPLARERRMTRRFCRDSAWPAAQAPSQRGLTAALWTGPVRTSSLGSSGGKYE